MVQDDSFYKDLLNNLGEGVYFTNTDRRITFWNRFAEQLTGFPRCEAEGSRCMENLLMHVDENGMSLCKSECPVSKTIADGLPRETEAYIHHKEGHRIPIRIRTSPITDSKGQIIGAVEIFADNSEKAKMTERLTELERQALIDPVTCLPNRRYLERHLESRIEELRRNQWPFSVLFIDIDHFKEVNDTYGHSVGDSALRMIGRTLDSCTRNFDVVGRWGGEEFLAIIANNREAQDLNKIGQRFLGLVAQSKLNDPVPLSLTVSIGGAIAEPNDSIEDLLDRADRKLYQAKAEGRNRLCL